MEWLSLYFPLLFATFMLLVPSTMSTLANFAAIDSSTFYTLGICFTEIVACTAVFADIADVKPVYISSRCTSPVYFVDSLVSLFVYFAVAAFSLLSILMCLLLILVLSFCCCCCCCLLLLLSLLLYLLLF